MVLAEKGTQCGASFNTLQSVLLAAALVESRDLVHPLPGPCSHSRLHYQQQGYPGQRKYPLLNPHLTSCRHHRGAQTPVASASLGPSVLSILRDLTRPPSRLDSSRTLCFTSWQVAQIFQSLDCEPEQNFHQNPNKGILPPTITFYFQIRSTDFLKSTPFRRKKKNRTK